MSHPEPDDYLHNPDAKRDRTTEMTGSIFTLRGLQNIGCLSILILGMLLLLYSVIFPGYPIIAHFSKPGTSNQGGFNLGGINASGQIPDLPGNFGLIDKDTPREAYTKTTYLHGEEWELVFSDEFNEDGRTFYPGDDPYWEAVDLHYWGTNDLEWYDPKQATTKGGFLELTLDMVDDPLDNHNMTFRSAMLQTWNKFCFTGGLIEALVRLPGASNTAGFWPALWTMGNLGRAGYGATNEGLWPYTYDACDVGTLPNQTYPGTRLPEAAVSGGDEYNDGALSYLPGQRLSACTCPGESHPGPMRRDGTYVGRSAPEIDIIEATIVDGIGEVSQSAQLAPFNAGYKLIETAGAYEIYDADVTEINEYLGGIFQQAASGLSHTNSSAYELTGGLYTTYGFEYKPGFDDSYITWVQNGEKAWSLFASALGPDPLAEISSRPVPQEPMYIITNLGISHNFARIQFDRLIYPATMSIDWIRVYQPRNALNVGCDPKEFPTAQYIETYKEVYTNPNITTWEGFGQPWPKNKLIPGNCDDAVKT
ncbi:beta-glucan synthesis-associated protein KRE6 [Coprinopsis sp. MPI-PUGE-AT-0042]|nr:beta-glucan synthesis-associated protein KRE6 [Coprinopsis sp. MPI-PUGE-AT-0042]